MMTPDLGKIKSLMRQANITQAYFSEVIGVSKASVCVKLNGNGTIPYNWIEILAVLLGIDPEELLMEGQPTYPLTVYVTDAERDAVLKLIDDMRTAQ